MLVSQVKQSDGRISVVARTDDTARVIKGADSFLELVNEAIANNTSLVDCITAHGFGDEVDLHAAYADGRLTLPIQHSDPAHMHMTGTGLTHLGSASTRNSMHVSEEKTKDADLTDSMKMFNMGIEGGKPEGTKVGAQPEWFYKGNGHIAIAPGQPLPSPAFALDGGEEPEIAGVYVIGPDGTPFRVGFALANEFSDHVTERQNYLFLAHSKLRSCAFGPEILIGDLPDDVQGMSRIHRDGQLHWEKPFVSGEGNMSHTLANLEHHHFKYDLWRQPGDVHVHMFGTATLSYADGIATRHGDTFEIEAPVFGLPLRNALSVVSDNADVAVAVRQL